MVNFPTLSSAMRSTSRLKNTWSGWNKESMQELTTVMLECLNSQLIALNSNKKKLPWLLNLIGWRWTMISYTRTQLVSTLKLMLLTNMLPRSTVKIAHFKESWRLSSKLTKQFKQTSPGKLRLSMSEELMKSIWVDLPWKLRPGGDTIPSSSKEGVHTQEVSPRLSFTEWNLSVYKPMIIGINPDQQMPLSDKLLQ